jgi:hypothetical protein
MSSLLLLGRAGAVRCDTIMVLLLPPLRPRMDVSAMTATRHSTTTIYQVQTTDSDPLVLAVARFQLDRLGHTPSAPATQSGLHTARWGFALIALFEQAGNTVHTRSSGDADSGHEPLHHSKSGACVWITSAAGRWYCRSCKRSGDAIAFVREVNGWSYRHACISLLEQFGPPDASLSPGGTAGSHV